MKLLKKLVTLTTAVAIAAAALLTVSCQSDTTQINIGIIKGPTGVGMAQLMDKSMNGRSENSYSFTVASSPDELVPKVMTGEIDIAALPTNVASTLWSKTEGKVEMLAVNTLGVLYMLENGDSINSVADLKGKTIYTSGQGANPEYVLRYVLSENGIDPDNDVTIEFVGTNDELTAVLVSGTAQVAMVPEPSATAALSKLDSLRRALDMSDEWDKISDTSSLMMGCVVARSEFIDEHPEAVKTFLEEYRESVEHCTNVDEVASYCVEQGIIPSIDIAKAAIPNCNIVYVDGADMKERISGYFGVLFDSNPASIGGALPDDSFYYAG